MQRQHVLLRLALNRNEPHRWPSYRFADRFGVARILFDFTYGRTKRGLISLTS
jgi:hypothetical protein